MSEIFLDSRSILKVSDRKVARFELDIWRCSALTPNSSGDFFSIQGLYCFYCLLSGDLSEKLLLFFCSCGQLEYVLFCKVQDSYCHNPYLLELQILRSIGQTDLFASLDRKQILRKSLNCL